MLSDLFELDTLKIRGGYNTARRNMLAMLMCKLAAPTYLYRDTELFFCSQTRISTICTDLLGFLWDRFNIGIRWHNLIDLRYIKRCAAALKDHGGRGVIWALIDGTFRAFCRPLDGQRLVYSGHKKAHGQKWQAIVTPDGLIIAMDGPYEGPANDVTMLVDSGVVNRLERMFEELPEEQWLYLYGDKAYSCNRFVLSPYIGDRLTPGEVAFNESMQEARLAVEWVFGWVNSKFTANQFRHNLKVGLQPVGQIWMVSVLLANCLTCLRGGNQVSKKFGMSPPSIEQYIAGLSG